MNSRHWLNTPELQHLAPAQRARMWQWAQEKAGIFGRHGCIGLIVLVVFHLVLALALDHVFKHTGLHWLAPLIPGISVFLCVGFLSDDRHAVQAIRDRLNVQFHGRLLPTCWKCGHILDGLGPEATRCPECGHDTIHGSATKEAIRRDRYGG